MRDFLRLTIAQDDDGTGELFAEVVANGFSGRSSAWFDLSQIADFASALGHTFPLDNTIALKGGYWSKESGGGLTRLAVEAH